MSLHSKEPCPEHVDALDRMLAGEEPVPGLEAHIEQCAACRRYVNRLSGLEAFLREAHERFDEMEPGALEQKRRVQPAKVAAWAAGFVIVVGLAAGLVLNRGPETVEQPAGPVAVAESEEGRVILASGLPSTALRPDGSALALEVGSRLGAGDEIVVPEEGSLVVRFPSGLTVLASASSRLLVMEAMRDRHVIRLEEGSLVMRSEPLAGPDGLLVRTGTSTVEQRGRLAAVRAERGVLTEVTAVRGSARVISASGEVVRVAEGTSMDATTGSTRSMDKGVSGLVALLDLLDTDGERSGLTVLSDIPATVSVDGRSVGSTPLTLLLTEGRYAVSVSGQGSGLLHSEQVEVVYGRESLVVVEAEMASLDVGPEVEPDEEGTPAGTKPRTDIVSRIREALAEGEMDEALALVEKHVSARKSDPAFMTAAGDTYRKLGRYSDAVDAYLAAATSGKGKASEKAYLAAARITLEKLRDPGRAELILGAYWKGFPAGFYVNEARFLNARLFVKQKRYDQARGSLEALLAASPKGYLATKARLLLGSILVTYMGDCGSAMPHLKAVQKAAPGGKYADEAARFMGLCNAK
jgi:TolA-binding protein